MSFEFNNVLGAQKLNEALKATYSFMLPTHCTTLAFPEITPEVIEMFAKEVEGTSVEFLRVVFGETLIITTYNDVEHFEREINSESYQAYVNNKCTVADRKTLRISVLARSKDADKLKELYKAAKAL